MKQFNLRLGNLEARIAHPRETLEIVQWSENSCWTIVSFFKSRDTAKWNAQFCEDRPFDSHVDWNDLRKLIRASCEYLENEAGI